jgi:hypothetical protein
MPLFQQNARPMTDAEIEKMVAPVALYPDPLLAQMLPAATFPQQVHSAAQYLRGRTLTNSVYANLDRQNYDLSVKSLARYPMTLGLLDKNAAWTAALGYAYGQYPAQTFAAIQRLRQRAYRLGTLYNNRYNRVLVSGNVIQIIPASPQYIYLPYYDPRAAFYTLPPGIPAIRIVTYSDPFSISAWLNREINWANQQIFYHGWQANYGGWIGASAPYIGAPGWFGAPLIGRPILTGVTIYPSNPVVIQPVYPQPRLYQPPRPNATAPPTGGLPARPGAIPMPKPRL